ncbi:sugar transporter [Litorivita sp. NS0012-18]
MQIKPLAGPARLRKRHRGLIVSFAFLVMLPVVVMSFYLWVRSADQYASTTAFTVQRETGGSAVDLLGGLSSLSGGGSSDTDILYEFIQSQELVRRVDAAVDLRAHYVHNYETDPIFSLKPDATLEDLVRYWQRIVRISYNQSASLIELRVLAFDPQTAQSIAEEIVAESQSMINALNAAAREDTIRYALFDLDEALVRLKAAREAMTAFRTRTQIVDPTADIQGRMGVLNNLQQQLAESLIEFDILSETTKRSDPRLQQAERRIEVIQSRIEEERATFATAEAGNNGADYPTLMAEFESLSVDREFSEEAYRAALAAVEIARSNAARKSRYLATYITPTLAQTAEYPQRITWTLLTALFSLLFWSICALVYYSIRDRQ